MTQRYPSPITPAMVLPIWVRTQQVMGGAFGDDVNAATATLLTDQIAGNGPNTAVDYTPRTQAAKATATGNTIVADVARRRGWIGPRDPYVAAPVSPTNDPTITSLAPNTIAAGSQPTLTVIITGTGFTQWSTVTSGNYPIPNRYISPTQLEIIQKPSTSVAGTVQVVVTDHGVASAPSNFVFT
jgi:hypothetical protein